jgi:hypothetical protein
LLPARAAACSVVWRLQCDGARLVAAAKSGPGPQVHEVGDTRLLIIDCGDVRSPLLPALHDAFPLSAETGAAAPAVAAAVVAAALAAERRPADAHPPAVPGGPHVGQGSSRDAGSAVPQRLAMDASALVYDPPRPADANAERAPGTEQQAAQIAQLQRQTRSLLTQAALIQSQIQRLQQRQRDAPPPPPPARLSRPPRPPRPPPGVH